MTLDTIYDARYDQSRALIIGINQDLHGTPLDYACNDANAVAAVLQNQFEFLESNVSVLLDKDATKESILAHLVRFADDDVGRNERIFVSSPVTDAQNQEEEGR